MVEQREIKKQELSKMSSRALTDLIVALLDEVIGPCHCRGRGGQRHRRTTVAPASPPQLPPSAAPHHRVLERPPSPSSDRVVYQPIEPSDLDTSPWGRAGSIVCHPRLGGVAQLG
jgi:hypothetical protein